MIFNIQAETWEDDEFEYGVLLYAMTTDGCPTSEPLTSTAIDEDGMKWDMSDPELGDEMRDGVWIQLTDPFVMARCEDQ